MITYFFWTRNYAGRGFENTTRAPALRAVPLI